MIVVSDVSCRLKVDPLKSRCLFQVGIPNGTSIVQDRADICYVACSLRTTRHFFNTLRPRQHGHHFAYDSFKRIFLNENFGILIKISLKFVHKGPINNIPALVQIMAWRRPGDKPLSEPMVGSLLTHICVTRPQWVKFLFKKLRAEETLLAVEVTWGDKLKFLASSIPGYFAFFTCDTTWPHNEQKWTKARLVLSAL